MLRYFILFFFTVSRIAFSQSDGTDFWYILSPEFRFDLSDKFEIRLRAFEGFLLANSASNNIIRFGRSELMVGYNHKQFDFFAYVKRRTTGEMWIGPRVDVSNNLKHLILSKDNVINIYSIHVESNNVILTPFTDVKGKFKYMSSLFFSEKNGLLAVGYEDGIIKTFRLLNDKSLTKHVTFNNHSSRVSKIEFISNSMEDILISTSNDNTIKLSDFNNSSNVTTLRGHQSWINDMIFKKSDATIQTVSEDRTLRNWFIYPNDIEKLLKE